MQCDADPACVTFATISPVRRSFISGQFFSFAIVELYRRPQMRLHP
jgi:hypothetical protein